MTRTALRALALVAGLCAALPAAADDLTQSRVVIPWSDFKTLYERGMAPVEKPETAPRDFALSKATYSGRLEGDTVVFSARMRVDVLKDKGWVSVPLLPTAAALRQARIGGTDAPIYMDGGWYRLVTDRRGTVTVDLEFAVTAWDSAGQRGFGFTMAPSGATEVGLTVASPDPVEFTVANAQQTTETSQGDRRSVSALLTGQGSLSVSWQRASADETPAVLEPRVYAEHHALVGVAEGVLQVQSAVNYSILHAGIDRLDLDLPADVIILDVQGKGLRDWSVTRADDRQKLNVELGFEAMGAYTLLLDYERPLPEGSASTEVPDLRINGVERIKGFVGIDARSSVEVAAGQLTAVSPMDVRELPPAILGKTDFPVLLGFKYGKEGWRVPLEIRVHDEVELLVTLVDQLSATTVLTPDGRRMTQVIYAMRNNSAQFLRLDLPDGAIPWSTFVAGRAVKPGRDEDGTILIPLTRSQTSGGDLARFAVEMVYVEDGEAPASGGAGNFAAQLPGADVPTTSVAWTVWVPSGTKVKTSAADGTLRPVDWFTPVDTSGITVPEAVYEVQQQANVQFDKDAMGVGVQPVKVTLPIDGQPLYFEKLLVLDEPLTVTFPYKAAK